MIARCLLLLVLLVGCGTDPLPDTQTETDAMSTPNSLPLEVTVAETKSLLDSDPDAVLIDCREQDEYDRVKIEGAELIPLSAMQERVDELTVKGDRPVIIHCHHGGRSLRAVNWLRQNGVPQAQSMAGGIDDWAVEIEPGMERY